MRVTTQESQGGMKLKDNDLKIKIQAHRRANNESKKFPRTRLKVSRKVNSILVGILTVAAAGQRDVNSQLHAHTLHSLSRTRWQLKDLQNSFRNSDVCCYVQEKCEHAGPNVTTSQDGNSPQQR
uniref:Uncharacterized protein n=1 Tax=Tanacetum cinerariifolium TaxID=118510 RepID=A0A699I6F2_TANCI|nr:hypothetical protein [Tanacetum cinerariifolium]